MANQKRKKPATRSKNVVEKDEGLKPYADEIVIVVTLVICILLILSNFGMCGMFGVWTSHLFFGLFGFMNYIVPVGIFIGMAFYLSNRGSRKARRKMISTIALMVVLMAILQLAYSPFVQGTNIGDYYKNSSSTRMGGGMVGGLISSLLAFVFDDIASFVILIAIAFVLSMFITEKLFFAPMGKKGYQKVQKIKEERRIQRAEYERCQGAKGREMVKQQPSVKRKAKTFTIEKEPPKTDKPEVLGGKKEKIDENGVIHKEKTGRRGKKKTSVDMQEITPSGIESMNIIRADSLKQSDSIPVYEETLMQKFNPVNAQMKTDVPEFNQSVQSETYTMKMEEAHAPFPECELESHERIGIFKKKEHKNDVDREAGSPGLGAIKESSVPKKAEDGEEDSDFLSSVKPVVVQQAKATVNEPVRPLAKEPMMRPVHEEKAGDSSITMSMKDISINEPETVSYDAIEPDLSQEELIATESSVENNGKATKNHTKRGTALQAGKGNISKGSEKADSAMEELGELHTKTQETIPYQPPTLELLQKPDYSHKGVSDEELKQTAMKLHKTLESFGVHVTINNVSCGPTVTRYELQPEQGVKVSKITGLADDIKLNLAAADIRIEAPIPGKAAVGIEVPNKDNSAVMLRELLESPEFGKHSSNIAFAVGKDIAGKTVVSDIAKMPHLLIAGATGSGKSVCINTLIMSILYKADPNDVKLIMIDPKVVELSVYNGIPHLLIPVVTDPKKASGALNWAVIEMTERYQKFAEIGVRDLKGYNAKVKQVAHLQDEKFQKMPQIVIIVDELADLMMVAPGEVEESICRLAQLARAAGIHLIIATQRPSVNVITGVIKANIPSRIAFSVSSQVDSRTILDGAGAEKLLGKGDMLFYPSGFPKPIRVQGAFVSDQEVSAVVEFLTRDVATIYDDNIVEKISSQSKVGGSTPADERDEYFLEAAKFIIEKDKASIGMLQRVFKIGFNRASRIMDQLYDAGVVGEEEGTKPRKVIMSMEQLEEYIDEYV